MSDIACPIWATPAKLLKGVLGDGARIDSPRAGGVFGISGPASDTIQGLSPAQKAIITTWLVDQRRFGTPVPVINIDVLNAILRRRKLRLRARTERFFKFLITNGYDAASTVRLVDDFPTLEIRFHSQHLMAWIEAPSFEEGRMFLRLLAEDGLFDPGNFINYNIVLTAKGYSKLDEVESGGADSSQAFVAMWFDKEMFEAWQTGFAPAIRDAGFDPLRIDRKEFNNKIDDEIVAEIKRSRFVVADFTCGGVIANGVFEPNPRGGVYYEAGLAHGLGMEVIFTCRADRMNYAHFDTRQFAHIVWKTPEDLRNSLYSRIAATVGEAPGAPGRGKGIVEP